MMMMKTVVVVTPAKMPLPLTTATTTVFFHKNNPQISTLSFGSKISNYRSPNMIITCRSSNDNDNIGRIEEKKKEDEMLDISLSRERDRRRLLLLLMADKLVNLKSAFIKTHPRTIRGLSMGFLMFTLGVFLDDISLLSSVWGTRTTTSRIRSISRVGMKIGLGMMLLALGYLLVFFCC